MIAPSRRPLKRQHQLILRHQHPRRPRLIALGQHGRVHVGNHGLSRSERAELGLQKFPAQMTLELAGKGIAFADEQVGAARDRQQSIGPFGVARISEGLVAVRQPQRGRRRTRLVDDFRRHQ